MNKKIRFFFLLIIGGYSAFAQSTYLPINTEDHQLLDRLETRTGRLCDTLCLSQQAESRKNGVNFLEMQLSKDSNVALSRIDRYNMEQMISENGEWAEGENGSITSKNPWFHTFYNKQYDFVYVKTKDFFLVVNPVINGTLLTENNDPAIKNAVSSPLYLDSHGAEARGWISKRLGFYTYFTDNQEQPPTYVGNFINKQYQAVPGADYYLHSSSKTYYDYLQASGYISFAAVKDYVTVTAGSGKHFIGDGISSLFLTDFSANMPFLELNARIWKLNYECLYLELTPQYNRNLGDGLLAHKYSTMQYLTWNATRWLNLGFFESVVFDRPNSYEISYLNPIILSNEVNQSNGNGDKALLGFSAKTIIAKHLQFYGQFMLNEFDASQFFGNKGWYGNKWGVQAGGKYFDAFTIKNLDLQGEVDVVRPYTYSAKDTLANYTNYNQPLADPLGSGFIRTVGIARYQPARNLYLTVEAMYYIQGNDTGGVNYGNNIFNPYTTAPDIYGVKIINGPKSHCELVSLNISYQVRRNLFFDIGGTYRKYVGDAGIYPLSNTTGVVAGPLTTNYVYFGIRLNAPRRDYNFF